MTEPLDLAPNNGAFHEAIRAAILARRATLDLVRRQLAERGHTVALSTLSNWQHGRSRPASLPVVHALEDVLDLAPGTLADLVPPRELSERDSPLADLLTHFSAVGHRDLDMLHRHDTVQVNAGRQAGKAQSRKVVRARHDGVDRYLVRHFAEPGTDLRDVTIEPVANCRLGAIRYHPTEPVVAAELLFDHSLRTGETWIFEHRTTRSGGPPTTRWATTVQRRLEQYVLEIRYHPEALPTHCRTFAQSDLHTPRRPLADLSLTPQHSVHAVTPPLHTGVYGIEWTW